MIINIHESDCGANFGFLPDLYLRNHEVCIGYVHIRLSETIEDSFVTLSSTLVDKNLMNPRQELISFFNISYAYQSRDLIHQPTQFSWYKLQNQTISDSFFNLHLEKQYKNIKIERIYIQLRIRPLCKALVQA